MESFTQTINGIEFTFLGFLERNEEVCRVSVDNQNFKMTVGPHGRWEILQQVPLWIKRMETELGNAIDKVYG